MFSTYLCGSSNTEWLKNRNNEYTYPWYKLIKPELAIYSAGRDNDHGHPTLATARGLYKHTIDVAPHDLLTFDEHEDEVFFDRDGGYLNGEEDGGHPHYHTEGIYSTIGQGSIAVETDGEKYWWSYEAQE